MPDKSNELTAIRQLPVDLESKGRVMSIDASGCQTDIAQRITDGGNWYLLAAKDNKSDLQRDFAYLDRIGAVAAAHDWSETLERGHGRTEQRTCTIIGGASSIRDELDPDHCWAGQCRALLHHQPTRGHRSCPRGRSGARPLAGSPECENSLHWVLDDIFREGPLPPVHGPTPRATWRPCGASH